jgi:hypothetical protein
MPVSSDTPRSRKSEDRSRRDLGVRARGPFRQCFSLLKDALEIAVEEDAGSGARLDSPVL